MTNMEPNKGEIVMYQPDETIRLEVRVENETVWLTQQQMAELFQTTRNNITLHIGNIFKEGELVDSAVRKESLLTAADGKKYKTKYIFGASLKDAGKKLFAYIRMQETSATELLNNIK